MMEYRGEFLPPSKKVSLSAVKGVEYLEQVTECCRTKVFAQRASYAVMTYHCTIITDRLTLVVQISDKLKQGPPSTTSTVKESI